MITLTAGTHEPLFRSTESNRPPLRVGVVQHRWRPDRGEPITVLKVCIGRAAGEGARPRSPPDQIPARRQRI